MLVSYASKIVRLAKEFNAALEAVANDNGRLPYQRRPGLKKAKHWHRNRARNRFKNKDLVPRAAPKEYAPLFQRTEAQLAELRKMLFAMGNVASDQDIGMTPDELLLIIDSGASRTIVNSLDDFVGQVHPVQNTTIEGISAGLTAEGVGTVAYTLQDDNGNDVQIEIKEALYVPDCPVRLVCPQQIAAQSNNTNDMFGIKGDHAILLIGSQRITIPYDEESNLPIIKTQPGCARYRTFLCHECTPVTAGLNAHIKDDGAKGILNGGETDNLTESQREMLKWHRKLSHRSFSYIKDLARKGHLPEKLANCKTEGLVCPDCKFGHQTKRPVDKNRRRIDEGDDKPGKGVSTDQMEAGTPGLIPTNRGRRTKQRHYVATIMVDHFSRLVYAHMSHSTTAEEAVEAKAQFENFARRFNVNIEAYRSDNGAYAAQEFRDAVAEAQQDLTLSGVGAHWQNGIAERYIGSTTRWARTMLLHAMSKWPEVITAEFWPYALRQAINIHNAMPQEGQDECPWTLFTDEQCPWQLSDFQVFGCPVYVLDNTLQDGNELRKWQSRSRLGVYVGHSTSHSGNVALVLNPTTLHVSPQYHVVFDNGFTTVSPGNLSDTKTKMDKVFADLFNSDRWSYADDYATQPGHYHFQEMWDPGLDCEKDVPAEELMARNRAQSSHGLLQQSEQEQMPKPAASMRLQPTHNRPAKRAKSALRTAEESTGGARVHFEGDVTSKGLMRETEGDLGDPPFFQCGDKIIEARQYKDAAISATKQYARK